MDSQPFITFKQMNQDCCNELVQEIVEKASGVFLWVRLVVRELLEGLQNEDGIKDLQRRLCAIPNDLNDYFTRMLSSLDPFYLEQAARLFQVALTQNGPLPLLIYYFILEDDPDYALKAKVREFTKTEVQARYYSAERRLLSRCKGLLEAQFDDSSNGKVDFLHKTVADFLRTKGPQEMFDSSLPQGFDAAGAICKAVLAQIKALSRIGPFGTEFRRLSNAHFHRGSELLWAFFENVGEVQRDRTPELDAILDDLHKSFQIHFVNSMDISPSNLFATDGFWVCCKYPSLTLTLISGLDSYVMNKLQEDPQISVSKLGYSLLDHLLNPRSRFKDQTLSPTPLYLPMVDFLLENGTSPNKVCAFEKFQTIESMNTYFLGFARDSGLVQSPRVILVTTVWGHLVEVLEDGTSLPLQHQPQIARYLFQVICRLVQYGADAEFSTLLSFRLRNTLKEAETKFQSKMI